jgi:hypothetical protein
MKSTDVLFAAAITLISLLVSACGSRQVTIRSAGDTILQELDLSGFEQIEVGNMFEVEVFQGERFQVIVETEESLKPYLEIETRGKTLKIGLKSGVNYTFEDATQRVEVTLPELRRVEITTKSSVAIRDFNTFGDIEIKVSDFSSLSGDIKADGIRVDIDGHSSVILSGTTQEVSGNMNKVKKSISSNPLGALITLIVVAVWGVWVLWAHMTRPLGIEHTEILFMSAMVPVYLILIPFYTRRVRWSYISGIIVLLGLFVGVLKSVLDQSLFFSPSAYNLMIVVVLLTALACIYFSLRSYLELPPVGREKSFLGIGTLLGISALAIMLVSENQMKIENFKLEQVIRGVQARTGDIDTLDDKIEALMEEGDIQSLAAAIVVNDNVYCSSTSEGKLT